MKTWIAVLSLLGGVFGLGSGFFVMAASGLAQDASMAQSGAWVFGISILAIALGFTAWKWSKPSGILLIIISVVGFIMNGLFFTLSFIFLLIAGIMALRYKPNKPIESTI